MMQACAHIHMHTHAHKKKATRELGPVVPGRLWGDWSAAAQRWRRLRGPRPHPGELGPREALRARTDDRLGKASSDGQITQEKCPTSLLTFKNQMGEDENNLHVRKMSLAHAAGDSMKEPRPTVLYLKPLRPEIGPNSEFFIFLKSNMMYKLHIM